jgi:recombinational DNA repair ATPase RecF
MSKYRIIKLVANNFKNLKAVEINPEGANVVTLAGPNGAGKSTVLDAIQEVISGGKDACAKPIREGANAAETTVVLSGGLVAKRRYTPSGSTLRIEVEGEVQKSPQAIMDKLKNILAFDPLSFTTKKPAEQREVLLQLLGLDFSAHDAEFKKLYDERTLLNREAATLAAQKAAQPTSFPEGLPDEPVSASKLLEEISRAEAYNASLKKQADELAEWGRAVHQKELEVAEAEKQLAAWQETLNARKTTLAAQMSAFNKAKAALAEAPLVIDVNPMRRAIETMEQANAAIAAKKVAAKVSADYRAKVAEVEAVEAKMKALEAAKQKAIRDAKFPLEGLSFDDGGIFFNGIPFAQISTGQQLRVSVAICMALNPTLRVIFIRDGSLLDQEALKLLAEMAEQNDYQIWIEDTRSTDPAAVVLQDGEIKS